MSNLRGSRSLSSSTVPTTRMSNCTTPELYSCKARKQTRQGVVPMRHLGSQEARKDNRKMKPAWAADNVSPLESLGRKCLSWTHRSVTSRSIISRSFSRNLTFEQRQMDQRGRLSLKHSKGNSRSGRMAPEERTHRQHRHAGGPVHRPPSMHTYLFQ